MNAKDEPLKIRRRGEDGYRLISVRLKESVLEKIDDIASQTNRSRNELINLIMEYGADNIIIE